MCHEATEKMRVGPSTTLEHRSSTPSFGDGASTTRRPISASCSISWTTGFGRITTNGGAIPGGKWWPTCRKEAMDPLYRNWRAVWRIGLLLSRDTKTLGMVQVFERRTGWARRVAPTINALGRSAEGRLARYLERSRDRPRHSPLAKYSST